MRLLTPGRVSMTADLPPGDFREYDLDADGRLAPVDRPWGRNTANIVAGVIRSFTPKHPEGMTRVILLGDPSREMGSLAEPECRRILGALDLAQSMRVPLEWFAVSAGAKISMESGTENMDWIARVLRRLIEFTQAGCEVNIIVTGINVGAQPYWNAEATMLFGTMHADEYRDLAKKAAGRGLQVRISPGGPPPPDGPPGSGSAPPEEYRRQKLREEAEREPAVQEARDLFDGRVVDVREAKTPREDA